MTDVWGFRNPVGLATLVRRELVRTYKVINQVIWPPIITTILYVLVFGLGLGSRVQNVQGVPYAAFLIPGLIMLQVIDQTYGESSSSLVSRPFHELDPGTARRAAVGGRDRDGIHRRIDLARDLDRVADPDGRLHHGTHVARRTGRSTSA